ncbi:MULTISPECIES: acetyl-CoA C-acetyltransferase [unclassified Hyphomonas]|jgi:acetyl-CoA C-acetyltransferase|uniref:3-ketoacyl-CoA thiolase @ Acetyl-CoA acetyltransferase n=2 Tax=root TaxID=1 RepID=A0A160U2R4_9ZZZZ|nr:MULTISPECIES: acetyl-CoA C-acetyltransferase [unclassified Hyphomonas]MAN89588.1 acetyl-CoA acetyltransferase [Hyphomonadaceae bacterium]MBL4879238.1 acetyl-CoA C-acetyltransferase [Hyphomonas sp.]MBO6582776.1 acetyl-CoA C-acetyltransferase [Hyphomonas sp.]MDF1805101.1 acetyl-CoA C-acetyltransferase [Hyphomonas sp.]QSR21769.1 acetyl-CoA acetyltransferase [Hyphomonas sp. KY3]|tara:strand:+ start:12 stop:1217 length:1206 start_codon:yes stop_codon:yes gene_type:complete
MTEAYIYDAVRTPRGKGKKSGSLHEITALSLATQVLQAIRDRNELDTSKVDDVVLGCVSPVGEQGADIARVAVLNADYAETTAGVQVDRFCASGLEACNMAASKVMTGEADMAIGGGVESMSRVPMGASGGAWSSDPQVALKTYFAPQGIGADTIATKYGFSRDDVDAFAVESQKRAATAWKEGRFAKSIVPVKDQMGGIQLAHDEHMRPDADMQSLAALNPSFAGMGAMGFDEVIKQRYPELEAINHVHHAGNSSGIVDGASAVLFGSKEMGEKFGLKPRARIRAMASIGSEPGIMLTGPTYVSQKVLKKAGMEASDIDLYELNEAFASVVLLMMQNLNIPHEKMNVNGGAIAMGHPLGATGGMILGTMVDELERSGKETALVTLCVGAGMGTATIIERV